MDYDTLVADKTTTGSIKYWINNDRIDSAGIVDEAEAWIYEQVRLHDMLSSDDVSIGSGNDYAALPTGYLDPVHLGIPGHIPTITLWPQERFKSSLGWDDTPQLPSAPPTVWSEFDGRINFNHRADQAYTAKMTFYKTPTALSSSNTTNWLTTRYPTLFRRTCLMFAAEARKQFDLQDRHQIAALQQIDKIKQMDDLSLRGMEMDFDWEGND